MRTRDLTVPFGLNFRFREPGIGSFTCADQEGEVVLWEQGLDLRPGVQLLTREAGNPLKLLFHSSSRGRTLVKVGVHEGRNVGDSYYPGGPHPEWAGLNRTIDTGTSLRQGVRHGYRENPEGLRAETFSAFPAPNGWTFRWEWPEGEVPKGGYVRVWLRPTAERGSGRVWWGALRKGSRGWPNRSWTCSAPGRFIRMTTGRGWEERAFPAGTLFDAVLQFCNAKPCRPIVVKVPEQEGTGADYRVQMGSRKCLEEHWRPLTDQELAELERSESPGLQVPAAEVKSLQEQEFRNLRAQVSGRAHMVQGEDLHRLLRNAGAGNMYFPRLDRSYRAVLPEHLEEFLRIDRTDEQQYRADAWDCDNFAMALAHRAGVVMGNCCGIVVDADGNHAYNIFLTHQEGEPDLVLVEPQSDRIVSRGGRFRRGERYMMRRGLIFWP